jgi:nitrite reductase (NADH) large subunit
MTSIRLPAAPHASFWRAAQSLGLVLTIALIVSLTQWPKETLHILWDMVIPLLPAVFLVNPVIWRNVCPLATLNATSGKRWSTRPMSRRRLGVAWTIGIVLLAVMVPARRFLFNTNGIALAATITVVALLALGAGGVFARRAAFCNGLCPVLPVEKLYGQFPLLNVATARCSTCTLCSATGCIELTQTKTVPQTLGPARKSSGWLITPFGVFAAAFPGFIVGYFTIDNGAPSSALEVYAHVALFSGLSYAIVTSLALAFFLPSMLATVGLGGTSVGLYYWFATPTVIAAYGGGDVASIIARMVFMGLVIAWTWAALINARTRTSVSPTVLLP